MRWLLDRLDTWQARVATGLAMLGALAGLLSPDSHWTLDWKALAAFVVSFIAWAITTLRGAGKISKHDVDLFDRFRELVTDDERRFLDSHDFLAPFYRERCTGLRSVALDWNDPRHDFIDKRIQRAWVPLRDKLTELQGLIGVSTMPTDRNPEILTVKHARDRAGPLSEETRSEAAAMNAAASAIVVLLDKFEHLARRRLH